MTSWIFPYDVIVYGTASREDNIDFDNETQYRFKTILFIENLGSELKVNKVVIKTSCVYLHRFFLYQSFKNHDRLIIATACIFLAAKVEECQTSVRSIMQHYKTFINKTGTRREKLEDDKLLELILVSERLILQTLCFDLRVAHLFKLEGFNKYMTKETKKDIVPVYNNFVNFSYRTTLCLQYDIQKINASCFFLATLQLGIVPIPNQASAASDKSWHQIVIEHGTITDDVLKDICRQLLDAYSYNQGAEKNVDQSTESYKQLRSNVYALFGIQESDEVGRVRKLSDLMASSSSSSSSMGGSSMSTESIIIHSEAVRPDSSNNSHNGNNSNNNNSISSSSSSDNRGELVKSGESTVSASDSSNSLSIQENSIVSSVSSAGLSLGVDESSIPPPPPSTGGCSAEDDFIPPPPPSTEGIGDFSSYAPPSTVDMPPPLPYRPPDFDNNPSKRPRNQSE